MARDKTSRLPCRAVVTGNRRLCATGTVLISFEIVDDEPFDLTPGEFVAIDVDHPRLGYRRSPYCVCTPPTDGRTFDLLVRIVPSGPVSVFLGELEPGDVVSFRGPSGAVMTPVDQDHDLVLMATGVGISPFCSLIPTLIADGYPRPITLYWGLRLAEDICVTDCLDQWVESHPKFSYAITLSQPPAGWQGLRGRLTESVPPLLESVGGRRFYLSGNGAMIAEMRDALAMLGVPGSLVFEEVFFNLRHTPSWRDVEAIRARFAAPPLDAGLEELLRAHAR